MDGGGWYPSCVALLSMRAGKRWRSGRNECGMRVLVGVRAAGGDVHISLRGGSNSHLLVLCETLHIHYRPLRDGVDWPGPHKDWRGGRASRQEGLKPHGPNWEEEWHMGADRRGRRRGVDVVP